MGVTEGPHRPPDVGMAPNRQKPQHEGMSVSAPDLDPTMRLRVATRIHFALLRHCGEQVSVSALLQGSNEMREALWVCEASNQAELVALATQFTRLAQAAAAAAPTAAAALAEPAAPQDAAWAQDSSGFGLSRPAEELASARRSATPATSAGWLSPARWLRRGSPR